MTADPSASFYRLDADDRIVEVGGAWRRFADENAMPEGRADAMVATSIYAHVAGHFTRRFLREFFVAARRSPQGATRTYRCDSPAMRRLMEMHAAPEGEAGGLVVNHRLVEESPLPHPIPVVEAAAAAQARLLRCSGCNRLKTRRGAAWREPEELLGPGRTAVPVVHTVCPDCRAGLAVRLRARDLSTE